MIERARAFFVHFNKPKSQQMRTAMWSVHIAGVCHMVKNFTLNAPVTTHYRSKQPICVLRGKGRVRIEGDRAIIDP